MQGGAKEGRRATREEEGANEMPVLAVAAVAPVSSSDVERTEVCAHTHTHLSPLTVALEKAVAWTSHGPSTRPSFEASRDGVGDADLMDGGKRSPGAEAKEARSKGHSHGHGHGNGSHGRRDSPLPHAHAHGALVVLGAGGKRKRYLCAMLEASIVVHSLIIGLDLGTMTTGEGESLQPITSLLIAICFHQVRERV